MTASSETVTPVRPDELQLQGKGMRVTIGVFVVVPLLAVLLAIPVAWGGWLSWVDVILAFVFYAITAIGITIGYHRYFTHGSFKAGRGTKIVLGIMGSMALQGSVAQWVADHRKHHKFSDEVGDPHSPWRYGTSKRAVAKGLYYAHVGWLFDESQSPDQPSTPPTSRTTRTCARSRAGSRRSSSPRSCSPRSSAG